MEDKKEEMLKSKHKKEEGKKHRPQDLKYRNINISLLFFKTYSALESVEKKSSFPDCRIL